MKKRIIIFLGSLIFLFSCAPNQVNSPALVLKIQEKEEQIINEQLQKKLDPIEGIWQANYGRVKRTEAFYKRGDTFMWVILQNDGGGQLNKTSEFNYSGKCKIADLVGFIDADLTILSTDDNTLDVKCVRKNFVSQSEKASKTIADILAPPCLICKKAEDRVEARDYESRGIYKRLWPENLKEHNSKF